MAELFWTRRIRVASAVLFGGSAFLAMLDLAARVHPGPNDRWLANVSLFLLAATIVSALCPWERLPLAWRLAPAVLVLGATLVAIYKAGLAETPHAAVGLVVLGILVLTYLGFSLTPGLAIAMSPLVLAVLVVAQQKSPDSLSLALPLVAVPAATLIAELVSALVDRFLRATGRDTRRLDRLARLETTLRRFRRPGSLKQAADQVAHAATEIFESTRATVVLRDTKGDLLTVTSGPSNDAIPGTDVAAFVSAAIAGDEPRMVETDEGSILVLPLPAAEAPAGAVLVYPIADDDPLFTLDLASLFSVQIGIAIEHLYVIDELTRATTRDALTGLGNRRHAEDLLRSLQPGDALVLLDLDGFKQVNDTLGHPAGDQVLLDLTDHLRQSLRDSDTSARLGGDEFLIVARRAHADPLALASRVVEGWRGRENNTTISAGVALHVVDASTKDTFAKADRALLDAKADGKDRARLANGPSGEVGAEAPA
jgi:diguanylate cyclase (GGDEF)-like protein